MWLCPRCKGYRFDEKCNCKKFNVESEDGEATYYAIDNEDAAIKYATDYNDEGDLMNDCIDLTVKDSEGNLTKFSVSVEPDVYYSANLKED